MCVSVCVCLCLSVSGYPDRREQEEEGTGCLVWGLARPKKSHQRAPQMGAGGLSCGRAPEQCPSHLTCQRPDIHHGERGEFSTFFKNL